MSKRNHIVERASDVNGGQYIQTNPSYNSGYEDGKKAGKEYCASEITTLREQVEKLKAELASIDGALNDPRANLTLTTSEIIWELKEQVEKLTKERDIKEHCIVQLEAEDLRMKEQLAAIAEQNEKFRKALSSACDHIELPYEIGERCAYRKPLSLPDLATPVLNKYRAEGMRMAAEICEHISDEYREREGRRYPELKTDAESGASDCESSIRARAAELEKTNG